MGNCGEHSIRNPSATGKTMSMENIVSSDSWDMLVHGLGSVYGSLFRELLLRLTRPCKRHYLRVNTLAVTRGELLDILRLKYPEYRFGEDKYYNDAVYITVKGPYRVPIVEKKIVVDYKAAESIMLGAPLYRPGILSYDEFSLGEEVNIISPNGIVVALARTAVSSFKIRYTRRGIVAEPIISMYKLPSIREMEEYREGLFYPQSLPSIAVTHILNPQPGETILDCCASPGGKTTHIIQYTMGQAKLIAIDRSRPKIMRIIDTISRLKLPRNIFVHIGDSRYIDKDLPGMQVDKALLDPPCTALGVRPKIIFNRTLNDLFNTIAYQRQFFKPLYNVLRKGGVLVYSTCTLTYQENEENLLYALKLGFRTLEGKIPYADKVYIGDAVAYRFHPFNNDMNGYFIAILVKPF